MEEGLPQIYFDQLHLVSISGGLVDEKGLNNPIVLLSSVAFIDRPSEESSECSLRALLEVGVTNYPGAGVLVARGT